MPASHEATAADSQFIDALPVAHLPVVRAVIDQLGIREVLDDLLPANPRNRVSDADCVVLMLLNILEGRVALYNMEKWLARTDAELLFGRNCSSNAFNDTRLAVCLDRIAEHGTDNILAKIVTGFLSRENQSSTRIIHNDTTSIKLLGAHDDPNAQPQPARGHSKDRRPDLKQLIFGLALDGAVGVPLTCSMLAGNTSDHTANRLHLDKLARVLPADDEATIVADCKLVDPVTLGKLLIEGFHFVSLLPATYKLRHDLIEQVRVEQTELPELHRSAGRTKASPPRVYRGRSVVRDFKVTWPQTSDDKPADHELVPLRFLVVESSQRAEPEFRRLGHTQTDPRASTSLGSGSVDS